MPSNLTEAGTETGAGAGPYAGGRARTAAIVQAGVRLLAGRLLPQDCILCAAASGPDLLCAPCTRDLPRMPEACPRCAMPSPGGLTCGGCLREPPSFARTVAVLPYTFPIDRLVQALKFRARLPLARLFGGMLAVATSTRTDVDLVVPMPLSPGRLRERGFNQSAEIARACVRYRGIVCDPDAARRVRETRPQSGLTSRDRERNVRAAFAAEAPVIGRHVAVVDDVMTTGASLEALAAALVRAGALSVECWVVARAFGPESPGGI